MINYNILGASIEYYENHNYIRIEAPWMVTEEISNITKPDNCVNYFVPECKKVLVASGEQSFLYLANKGLLPPGKYQTTTPCFRNEPIDITHRKCFIKNELIQTNLVNYKELESMINLSLKFFEQYIPKEKLKVIKTDSSKSVTNYDIVAIINNKELELGSYGIRNHEILDWIYGTGCAEPRLSLVLKALNKGSFDGI